MLRALAGVSRCPYPEMGNTAAVGGPIGQQVAPGRYGSGPGTEGSGGQQGTKLVGSGAGWKALNQGSSVSLSADGNMAIVGGRRDNSDSLEPHGSDEERRRLTQQGSSWSARPQGHLNKVFRCHSRRRQHCACRRGGRRRSYWRRMVFIRPKGVESRLGSLVFSKSLSLQRRRRRTSRRSGQEESGQEPGSSPPDGEADAYRGGCRHLSRHRDPGARKDAPDGRIRHHSSKSGVEFCTIGTSLMRGLPRERGGRHRIRARLADCYHVSAAATEGHAYRETDVRHSISSLQWSPNWQ